MDSPGNNIILQVEKPVDIFYNFIIPLSSNRLLNHEVEQVIVEEAEALPGDVKINLVLKVTGDQIYDETEIVSSVRKHFKYQHERAIKEKREIVKLGWKSLVIAFAFLVAIYFFSRIFMKWLPGNPLLITLREMFIILGWVALWRPAELLLYDWRPSKRKAKLFSRIAASNIQIVHKNFR